MFNYNEIDLQKKAFIFELDDVLYPKQDYILQVYYLFANILEYTQQKPTSAELSDFLKHTFLTEGEGGIFEKAAEKFSIDHKYKENFSSMHVNAKLPLKLLLYKEMLSLLTYLIGEEKLVVILAKGNPLMQFNKIKQLEWNGLEQFIKVYFYDEIVLKSELEPFTYVLRENNIAPSEAVFISLNGDQGKQNDRMEIDHIDANIFLRL